MSVFVDATLLRFERDEFVTELLTDHLGPRAIFDTVFRATGVDVQSIELGPISARSYKVPAFESLRSRGTDERIVPDVQRVRTERTFARFGRLEWVDVAFEAVLVAKVQTRETPLASVTVQSLEKRLAGYATIEELRAKLLGLYPPSMVDDIFDKLRISTLEDFERQIHLFVEFVGRAVPDFDPNDPAVLRSYEVSLRVQISDRLDVAGALQSAKLCRSILEYENIPDAPDGVERISPFAFVALFPDATVTDDSLPDFTAAQAKAAIGDLFKAEHMFATFIN